jgi:glycosyltransferase involved in cell wall biosynthesis
MSEVAVILPVRNCADYLPFALESILSQTVRELDVLVVDDRSTDGTARACGVYQRRDSRVRLASAKGSGLVDALNQGIEQTAAPLIARMDADDIALPKRLELQREFLHAHSDIAAVGTQVRFIGENGRPTGKTSTLPVCPAQVGRILLKFCCIRHPTVMMRRSAVEKAGGYRNQAPYAEDLDLWLRVAENGKLANLDEVLLEYRQHPAQISEQRAWTQRLSRNLAVISARERRAGRPDPLASYPCYDAASGVHVCRNFGCFGPICESIRRMDDARRILTGERIALENARRLLRYVGNHSVGDGQSMRLQTLLALCRQGWRQKSPMLFGKALSTAFRINPGRTLRQMLLLRS